MSSVIKQGSPEACIEIEEVSFPLSPSASPGGRPYFELSEFRVERGEQLAITGPSGCGKSTLLHLLAGLRSAPNGTVKVCGVDLQRLSEDEKDLWRGEKVGLIFQQFQLLADFTALENVQLGARFSGRKRARKKDAQRATELLDLVGLSDHLHRKTPLLSVGQQQRVAIARALIKEPSLLLADEPTGSLDPQSGLEIFALLKKSAAQFGAALLMVTHDLALAKQLPRNFAAQSLLRYVSDQQEVAG